MPGLLVGHGTMVTMSHPEGANISVATDSLRKRWRNLKAASGVTERSCEATLPLSTVQEDQPAALFQGSINSTPQCSKSAMFLVASRAPARRAMATIWASNCEIGRPSERLWLTTST